MRPQATVLAHEEAVVFACEGEQLLGVISSPPAGVAATGIGVVIVVGGPQYRAGSHRQFVLLARALAAQGHHCLRFDYRGMGDSTGAARDFMQVDADIATAVAALRAQRAEVRRLVLWGLCDAASAILMHLDAQAPQTGIDGIVLLNPWIRSDEGLARAQVKHYYTRRLLQADFWRNRLRHGITLAALSEFATKLWLLLRPKGAQTIMAAGPSTDFRNRMAMGLHRFSGPVLLVLSGRDLVAKEFEAALVSKESIWHRAMHRSSFSQVSLAKADHTFSDLDQSRELERQCQTWLAGLWTLPPSAKV